MWSSFSNTFFRWILTPCWSKTARPLICYLFVNTFSKHTLINLHLKKSDRSKIYSGQKIVNIFFIKEKFSYNLQQLCMLGKMLIPVRGTAATNVGGTWPSRVLCLLRTMGSGTGETILSSTSWELVGRNQSVEYI